VRINAIHAYSKNLSVKSLEFSVSFAEFKQFCRANKSEVERVEKEKDPFAFVVFKSVTLLVTLVVPLHIERRNRLVDLNYGVTPATTFIMHSIFWLIIYE